MVTVEDEDNNNSESSATTTTRNNKRKRLLKQKQIIITTTITVSKPFSNLPTYTLKKVSRRNGKTQQLKLSK